MKIIVKYVLQGRYKGETGPWNPWQDEAKEEKLNRIQVEYRVATGLLGNTDREFRIVKRTITETDEVIS